MQTTLSVEQIEEVRKVLLGADALALVDLIFRLNISLPTDKATPTAMDIASKLGWVTCDSKPRLTALGWLVADPLREYWLWLDRERRIHGERESALLVPERYAGKSVLEVGSGFGCNLLSLSLRTHGQFVGVEPMALYRQFTPLLAEREGIVVPEVVDGVGEALPFADRCFDIVLCYSAHQYMDLHKALVEMARVLKPGGQLQIIGGTLNSFTAGLCRQLIRHPSASATQAGARIVANTLSYQWLGRRMLVSESAFATAAPIYPSRVAMYRWIKSAGLILRQDLVQRVGVETCFVADKP